MSQKSKASGIIRIKTRKKRERGKSAVPQKICMKIYILTLFATLIIAGCAGKREFIELPFSPVKTDVADLVSKLNMRDESIRTIIAKGQGEFHSSEGHGPFGVQLFYEKPLNIFVAIKGTFGMEIAKIFYNGDSLFVFVPQTNTLYYSAETPEFTILKNSVAIKQILLSILGFAALPCSDDSRFEIRQHSESGLLIATRNGLEILMVGGNNEVAPISHQFFTQDSLPVADVAFDSFYNIRGILFPSSVMVTDFRSGDWVKLRYDEVRINTKIPDNIWVYSFPAGVQKRKLYK